LEGKAKASVEVVFPKEDGEAYLLARQFFGLLQEVGWQVGEPIPIPPDKILQLSNQPLHVAAGGEPA
jgi:hypothetical protein